MNIFFIIMLILCGITFISMIVKEGKSGDSFLIIMMPLMMTSCGLGLSEEVKREDKIKAKITKELNNNPNYKGCLFSGGEEYICRKNTINIDYGGYSGIEKKLHLKEY